MENSVSEYSNTRRTDTAVSRTFELMLNQCSDIQCNPVLQIGIGMINEVHVVPEWLVSSENAGVKNIIVPSCRVSYCSSLLNFRHVCVDACSQRGNDESLQKYVLMKATLNTFSDCVPFRIRSKTDHSLTGTVIAVDALCRGHHYSLQCFLEFPTAPHCHAYLISGEGPGLEATRHSTATRVGTYRGTMQLWKCTTTECYGDIEYKRNSDSEWRSLSELLTRDVCSFDQPLRRTDLIPCPEQETDESPNLTNPVDSTTSHIVTIATISNVWKLEDNNVAYEDNDDLFMTPIQEVNIDSTYEFA